MTIEENKLKSTRTISLNKIELLCFCVIVIVTPVFSDNANFKILWGLYAIFIGLMCISVLQKPQIVFPTELMFFSLFVFYCWISNIWAKYNGGQSIQFPLLMLIFSIMACVCLSKIEDYIVLFKAIVFGGTSTCLYIVFSTGLSNYFQSMLTGQNRLGGMVLQENALGSLTAISAILSIGLIIYGENKIIFGFVTLVNLFILFGAASRMSLIMLIFGCAVLLFIVYVIWAGRKISAFLKYAFIVIAILIIGWIIISHVPAFSKMYDRFSQLLLFFSGQASSAEGTGIRSQLISLGLEQFSDHFILGIGYNNARYAASQMIGQELYAHNNYVEILENGGLIGFLLFYLPYFLLFKKLIRKIKTKRIEVAFALVLLVLICIESMAGVPYLNKTYYIYMILIISIANSKAIKLEQQNLESY